MKYLIAVWKSVKDALPLIQFHMSLWQNQIWRSTMVVQQPNSKQTIMEKCVSKHVLLLTIHTKSMNKKLSQACRTFDNRFIYVILAHWSPIVKTRPNSWRSFCFMIVSKFMSTSQLIIWSKCLAKLQPYPEMIQTFDGARNSKYKMETVEIMISSWSRWPVKALFAATMKRRTKTKASAKPWTRPAIS